MLAVNKILKFSRKKFFFTKINFPHAIMYPYFSAIHECFVNFCVSEKSVCSCEKSSSFRHTPPEAWQNTFCLRS